MYTHTHTHTHTHIALCLGVADRVCIAVYVCMSVSMCIYKIDVVSWLGTSIGHRGRFRLPRDVVALRGMLWWITDDGCICCHSSWEIHFNQVYSRVLDWSLRHRFTTLVSPTIFLHNMLLKLNSPWPWPWPTECTVYGWPTVQKTLRIPNALLK